MKSCIIAALAAGLVATSTHALSADAQAAEGLARQSGCFKCHAVDKAKVGPPFHDSAARYKADKEAAAKLTKHVTGGGKMKLGGSEQDHPAVKSKSPQDVKNLVDWILSL